MTEPQMNVPLTSGDKMTLATYAMLKGFYDELQQKTLRSPDGNLWKITVDNSGNLSATPAT